MSKFTIKVELEALKIEIEGSREDVPRMAQKVGDQIGNLVKPALLLEANRSQPADSAANGHVGSERRKPRARRSAGKTETQGPATGVVDWNHDAPKWGTPIQSWKQWQKVLWLLSVVEQEMQNKNGLTSTVIAEVFNRKFRASGLLRSANIARDLASKADYFGSVDGNWFLKQGGKDEAVKLVADAKGTKVNAATA